MSTDRFRRYGHLLKADGTNQLQRTLPALEDGYILPDERSLSDLVRYARGVAAELRFYNGSGQSTGDWTPFLEPLLADPVAGAVLPTAELEAAMATRRDWPPHVALFLVFLELFKHLQADLNELPRRHLSHYYEKVLSLERRAAAADRVHVVFELARNAARTLLPAGTVLDAGKDAKGRALSYQTTSELAVSAARVAEIRRLVAETDYRGKPRFFVADAVGEDEAASWHTFGRRQLALAAEERSMSEAEIGFAIASPLLSMAEGERTVNVVAQLSSEGEAPPPLVLGHSLEAALTGAEGWLALPANAFEARLVERGGAPMTLELDLRIGEGDPAVVPFDAALHGEGPASEWPVLKVLLRGASGLYETLEPLRIGQVDLQVSASGVRELVLHNDQGPLSPEQPIPLFGSQPRIGSRFYVGSAEVFSKKLSSLALHLEWQGVPEDLLSHYRGYFVSTLGLDGFDDRFLVEAHLLYERSWDHRLLFNETLFGSGENRARSMIAGPAAFANAFAGRDYAPQPRLAEIERLGPGTQHGFVRLTLTDPVFGAPQAPDVPFEAFGHQAFSRRYATQAIALSRHDPASGDPEPELPNEPYTPTLASLSLNYTATAMAIPGASLATEELYVLGPWGHTRAGDVSEARLVPALSGDAALFLGLEGLEPPANVSLLFQIDSGTASAEPILGPGEVEWSYLSGQVWRTLPAQAVLSDSTFGFQQPGLVVLSIGRDATTQHTAMPAGKAWLRGLIRRPPESAARTQALRAQAALARFGPEGGTLETYEEHLRQPLAAQSIQRLRKRDAAIKKVEQPFASFGGRTAELDDAFFRRCSERLRHRNRAVTVWDVERLVLEAFPAVFKVKCLPHSDADGNDRAGEVALVIVPDLRSGESTDLLEPRAGAALMAQVEAFIGTGRTTPFARVHVIHPVYERILVEARVAFRAGLDAGYYANLLDRELQQFLSPWAFEDGEDIVFGARIYRSEVLAFVEGRDYVEYVTGFNLYHSYRGPRVGGPPRPDPRPALAEMAIGTSFVIGQGVEAAQASRPHSILVSHPTHRITPIEAGEDLCLGVEALGIGFMTIGLDFIVHPD